MKPKRLGKFSLSMSGFEHPLGRDLLQQIFSTVLVIRAEAMYSLDCIDYIAFSKEFRELKDGEMAPTYTPITVGNEFIHWEEVDGKEF